MEEYVLPKVLSKAEALCRERGEVTLSEIAKLSEDEGIRGSIVIDELAISDEFTIDWDKGTIICRSG